MNAHNPPPKPKRRQGLGKPLSQGDRDTIVGTIGRLTRERVIADLKKLDPNRNNDSAAAIVREVRSDAAHRFSSTTLTLLTRLARQYRGGDQATLPLAPATPARQAAVPNAAALAVVQQPLDVMNAQTISTIVISVLQALGHGVTQPTAPRLAAPAPDDAANGEPGIKNFDQMPESMQRGILNSMHNRFGDSLSKNGLIGSQHATAWNISYDAYEKATGSNIKARATVRSDSTGQRVRPIDIVQEDGALVEFWQVCRKTWER